MIRRLLPVALAVLSPALSLGQLAAPDTPAGRILARWIDAFNSGDRARIDAFVQSYDPTNVDGSIASAHFRGQSGGVTLLSVDRSQPLSIGFTLKEKAQPTVLVGRVILSKAEPAAISTFSLRAVPPGAVAEELHLTPALRQKAIEDIARNLTESYVDPATADKMAASLRAHEAGGDYQKITDGDEFAIALTAHLVEVSHDKHLHVFYSPYRMTSDPPPLSPEEQAESRRAMVRDCGFRKLEILPNNIGYVKLDFFSEMMTCGRTAAMAISFLANTDAVIFDLRGNGGGDPRMVAFLCTYLFDQPVHLNDLWDRRENKTTEYWTLRYVPGLRLGHKPAYVLTSKQTFSGAEEFAYDLQFLKRATVVGETTGGGSHPVSGHRAGDHFVVYVPFARITNPVTKADWEQTGVTPDIRVPADQALQKATQLAATRIQETSHPLTPIPPPAAPVPVPPDTGAVSGEVPQ